MKVLMRALASFNPDTRGGLFRLVFLVVLGNIAVFSVAYWLFVP